jgi:hypothetical protein
MKVEAIRDEAALVSLRRDWEAITRARRDPYPFSTFAWMQTWWEHMPRRDGFAQRHALARSELRSRALADAFYWLKVRSRSPVRHSASARRRS